MALLSYFTTYARNLVEGCLHGNVALVPPDPYYYAFHTATQLASGCTSGTNTISVNDPIVDGANLIIAPAYSGATDLNVEQHVVDSVSGSGPYTITLVDNLAHNHLAGAYVAFDPGDDCAELLEPPGNNYARTDGIANDLTSFPAPTDGITQSGVQITWPAPSGPWGLCTHVIEMDDPMAGNAWNAGVLDSFQLIDIGSGAPKVVTGNYQPETVKPS